MRRHVVATIAAMPMVLAWAGTALSQTSIEQHAEGACSPPIVNNQGHVSISCQGVDEKALRFLEEKLSTRFTQLAEQLQSLNEANRTIRNLNDLNDTLRKQADEWAERYKELSGRLAGSRPDTEEARQARTLIQQGKFADATRILEVLAASQEDDVSRAAKTQFDLGDLKMLAFEPSAALLHYEKAFRYRPDNPEYATRYAYACYRERRFSEAERGFTGALRLYRQLATGDPDRYEPKVGESLNNLGNVYRFTGRLADAESSFNAAVAIRRGMVARHSGVAEKLGLADTLNNLGGLYRVTGKTDAAVGAYNEALEIFRELAPSDPRAFRPRLALALDNLGVLYQQIGRLRDAETASRQALPIFRDLAAGQPEAYLSDLGKNLSNLGSIYLANRQVGEAEGALEAAVKIYRKLAAQDAAGHQPDLATILDNLGGVYVNIGRLSDAESVRREALSIYRILAANAPDVYRPDMGITLANLGATHLRMGRISDARKELAEALSIYRDLASKNPEAYAAQADQIAKFLQGINPQPATR